MIELKEGKKKIGTKYLGALVVVLELACRVDLLRVYLCVPQQRAFPPVRSLYEFPYVCVLMCVSLYACLCLRPPAAHSSTGSVRI